MHLHCELVLPSPLPRPTLPTEMLEQRSFPALKEEEGEETCLHLGDSPLLAQGRGALGACMALVVWDREGEGV